MKLPDLDTSNCPVNNQICFYLSECCLFTLGRLFTIIVPIEWSFRKDIYVCFIENIPHERHMCKILGPYYKTREQPLYCNSGLGDYSPNHPLTIFLNLRGQSLEDYVYSTLNVGDNKP